MHRYLLMAVVALFYNCNTGFAQALPPGVNEIEKAIKEERLATADSILQIIVQTYYARQNADSLVNYVFYVGKVAYLQFDVAMAIKKLEAYIDKIKKLKPGKLTLRQTYIEAGEFYGYAGKNSLAYNANLQAYHYGLSLPGSNENLLGLTENNLSTYAQRKGDLQLSQQHSRRALQYFLKAKDKNYEGLYIAYNGMGTTMWYGLKTDSTLYYFDKALVALNKTPRTPLNMYYRPAILQNNLSGVYSLAGNATAAITAMKICIEDIRQFIDSKEPHPKKGTAVTFQFEATDNLAGIYKELGDLRKAKDLLEYSYRQKQLKLNKNNPAIFISEILLGQLYYAMRDFDKSLQFLQNGLQKISTADGDYLFWQADACNTLALLYDAKKETANAAHFYERADSLYEVTLAGDYDNIYLDFLRNAAQFYAEHQQPRNALIKANKGFNYVAKTQGPETLMAFYQLVNLAEVNLALGNYNAALSNSNKSLAVVNKRIKASDNLLDSIKFELKKPRAILLKAKATYSLEKLKDVAGLESLLKQLNEALDILERRKAILTGSEDIALVMADNNELLEFIKKITLDLYKLTKDEAYIIRVMSLNESGLYNRIRTRLDKNDSLQFADIPTSIKLKEATLKAAISNALTSSGAHNEKLEGYFAATDDWNKHLLSLQRNYPRYYKTRYASIFKTLGEIKDVVPANTTLIRYFFVDKHLFALLADNRQKQIVELETKDIAEKITALSTQGTSAQIVATSLFELYQKLWAPLANNIRFKKIIIIPDGILYNLNFDILTPRQINNYRQLASNCLLANYTISYQYSLFLLQQKNRNNYAGNFVAFAPGFSDAIKNSYKSILKDSIDMDRNYLSLLPQPFALSLAGKIKQMLKGEAYLNDQSTEQSFKLKAGNHAIIHLGTHAEANNDHPQFSRLIFARNGVDKEDNSLFAEEIYNCKLSSELTVLTACESGKPGYEDGEGMISLAHAFNYAGSESILTGLWKIDEQASAMIMEFFYKNLVKGFAKDEALRQAKLSYLQQAKGRMLAPEYWGGLIIMGDVSPIVLKEEKVWWPYLVWGTILIVMAGVLLRKKPGHK